MFHMTTWNDHLLWSLLSYIYLFLILYSSMLLAFISPLLMHEKPISFPTPLHSIHPVFLPHTFNERKIHVFTAALAHCSLSACFCMRVRNYENWKIYVPELHFFSPLKCTRSSASFITWVERASEVHMKMN
jgi:hypothetical protein